MDENYKYRDIENLKRPKSNKYRTMPLLDRAAQFSPYAALTGYDDAVKEAARLTQEKIILDESEKEIISNKIILILENLDHFANIKYFIKDDRKSGGKYNIAKGNIKKFDGFEKTIKMENGLIIPIEDIVDVDSPIFNFL